MLENYFEHLLELDTLIAEYSLENTSKGRNTISLLDLITERDLYVIENQPTLSELLKNKISDKQALLTLKSMLL